MTSHNKYLRWMLLSSMGVVATAALIYALARTFFFVSLANAADADLALGPDILEKTGVVQSRELDEISGISYARKFPEALWMHNDSGNAALLYLVGLDGSLIAKCKMPGAANVDWEDMEGFDFDGSSYLLVGDVGDNSAKRRSLTLYLAVEPKPSSDKEVTDNAAMSVAGISKISFTYEDGPRDCEAIAFDTSDQTVWLVEKLHVDPRIKRDTHIYQLDLTGLVAGATAAQTTSRIAKRVATIPIRNVTGMSFSYDNRQLVVRTYLAAYLFQRQDNQTWLDAIQAGKPLTIALPLERQGEAICFSPDGKTVMTVSEHRRQPIYRVKTDQKQRGSTEPGRNREP